MNDKLKQFRTPLVSALLCSLLGLIPAAGLAIVAIPSASPGGVYWQVMVPNDGVSLRVIMPGGSAFEQHYPSGQAPWFASPDGGALPDGAYSYELVISPVVSPQARAKALSSRESGQLVDLPPGSVESGVFRVTGGVVVLPDPTAVEPRAPATKNKTAALPQNKGTMLKDQVIADDLIVQGSACIGLDCVNNESFGFDTIRLKENNTRIKFEDTSTGTGFPTHDWQLTANDSASGGANKFSIEDITSATVPFTITGSAPNNSIFVDSTGRVGLRTSTPVLDLHISTGNTPAARLEQTSAGGFTAQTWDVAGNEANFFVRDVTGGSRLPFRIRPGAPTSSIDINASGNVGIGTASPNLRSEIKAAAAGLPASSGTTPTGILRLSQGVGAGVLDFGFGGAAGAGWLQATNSGALGTNFDLLLNPNGGNVGIGILTPGARLHTTGSVRFAGVANCAAGIVSNANGDLSCLVSSRQFKNVEGDLAPLAALANVMALRPQVGSYKATPDEPEHWLIAEEVAAVDPALVGRRNGEPYTVKTQGIVADLVAVIQAQQRRIEALERAIAKQ